MSRGARHGFTLVELMIVVAIIAIVAAIALPSFVNSRKLTNETRAIGTLRSVSSVQEQYRTRFGSYATDFEYLVEAGYLDIRFDAYDLVAYGASETTWFVSVRPTTTADGDRWFWCDETGVIRFEYNMAAGPSSSPVGANVDVEGAPGEGAGMAEL